MTMTDFDMLIDKLAADAVPVRRQSTRSGRMLLAGVAAATFAAVAAIYGVRADFAAGSPSPMIGLAVGLMLILAVAAGAGAVRMARPQVGAASSGAPWALAALLLLPVLVIAGIVARPDLPSGLEPESGLRCLTFGAMAGATSLAFLTMWLRRGAPVAPQRAAWLAGLASGAIGALAVTLECPRNELAHLGIWHVAAVLATAGAARLLLPRLLRW